MADEKKKQPATFMHRFKDGTMQDFPVDQEPGSIADAYEKFKVGYEKPDVDEARKRAQAARDRYK